MLNWPFLTNLLDGITVSGLEHAAQDILRGQMEPIADEIRTDEIGDTICILNPNSPLKILLSAHVDEIGLVVSAITDNGRLLVINRGGIIPATYPGHSVKIVSAHGTIFGVVESYRDLFKKEDGLKASDFLIDIGVDKKKEAQALVPLGSPIVFDTPIRKIAGGRFTARALDDRLGVYIIMEALRKAKEKGCSSGVYSAATVGEETTKNGAYWTASRIKPDLAIVVDVTYTSDYSGTKTADSGEVTLGGGPVLCNGPLVVRSLNEKMTRCAKKLGITIQIEAASHLSYTDADKIHFAGDGVPTVLVSIPLRYMHHPAEMADSRDVEQCIDLIVEFLMECGD